MGKPAPFLVRFLTLFFYLLYQPLAWTYDLVAWVVSIGRWQSWIYSTLPELRGPRVLELGYGPGHLQVAMRNRDMQPFGIDLSPQMGKLASSKLWRANFPPLLVRARGQQLPFAAQSFDQLVATFPTEYILLPQTLAEAKRVLKQQGKIVLLPVAWITAKDPINRVFAWLFRITGQAGEWTGAFGNALRADGFAVEEKRVMLPGSEAMLVIATKAA